MKKVLVLLFMIVSPCLFAQDDPTAEAQPIVAEGKLLYRSEMASWYGTDLFLAKYKNRSKVGGYLSYTEGTTSKCIFFSNASTPVVIGTMSFDSTYDTNTAITDLTERSFTAIEMDLFKIRKVALEEISTDTLFKTYKNTNLNLIPLINSREKKVYVLTGPTQTGVVIFGNDYLLTFDENNNVATKKQLHKNIIPVYYGKVENEEGAMHSQLPETGDFITTTDICTLMLYEKYAKWKMHNVVSKKYLNIWNCETDELTVITMEAVDKINKDQEKKNKKKN